MGGPAGSWNRHRRHRLRVPVAGSRGYEVLIGPGLLEHLPVEVAAGGAGLDRPPARVAIVADRHVSRLYGESLARRFRSAGLRTDLLSFPAGERHKTRETKSALEDRLARTGFPRDGLVVALGGGVTGDLAGFVAATWHRGVALIQAPTTLIAMLDASIGGKVGVDHPLAKNLIGAFHAPRSVRADTSTLGTLSSREFRAGLAEAVKCGVIADADLFGWLERRARAILSRDGGAVEALVARAVRVKTRIVSADERESGARQLLNFGHTIGHALEAASGYELRHGEAVSIGMVFEARLAVGLGHLSASDATRIEALLKLLGLPLKPPRRLSVGALVDAIALDKKGRRGEPRFVLPSAIGTHAGGRRWSVALPLDDLGPLLGSLLAAAAV